MARLPLGDAGAHMAHAHGVVVHAPHCARDNPAVSSATSPATAAPWDLAIIGAGPAGCSAALWAAQLGLRVGVIERASAPCPLLVALPLAQNWVLGEPDVPLPELAARYAAHAQAQPGVCWHLGCAVTGLAHTAQGWRIEAGTQAFAARGVVVATGLAARRHAAAAPGVLDAVTLTQQRAHLAPGRTLLLGGGDNALENARYLAERGHHVAVRTRGAWRGRAAWLALLAPAVAQGRVELTAHALVPATLAAADNGGLVVVAADGSAEHFDHVAVLWGFAVEPAPWRWLHAALPQDARALACRPGDACPALHWWVAGDAAQSGHPCVQTALASGVNAAQAAAAALAPPA